MEGFFRRWSILTCLSIDGNDPAEKENMMMRGRGGNCGTVGILKEVRGAGMQSISAGVLLLEKHDKSPIATGEKAQKWVQTQMR